MITTKDLYLQYAKLERLWELINIKKDLRNLKKIYLNADIDYPDFSLKVAKKKSIQICKIL